MPKLLRDVLQFYGTVAVPLLYGVGLWLISYGGTLDVGQNWQMVGVAMTILGLALWVTSYAHLGRHFGVLPRAQTRTKRGIYSVISHPMYKGIFMTYFGLSLANRSEMGVVYTAIVLFPLLYLRARAEDQLLRG